MLERLSCLGDRLIVGVSTDLFNQLKGKEAFFTYDERAEIVASCRYVDLVIPENSWEQKRDDIIRNNVSIFGIGEDWKGKFNHLSPLCQVVYLNRTKKISTTLIKKHLSSK